MMCNQDNLEMQYGLPAKVEYEERDGIQASIGLKSEVSQFRKNLGTTDIHNNISTSDGKEIMIV